MVEIRKGGGGGREPADGLKGPFEVILVSFSPTGHFEVPATAC